MLDKAIEKGTEHRKPYRRSKAFDLTCRNHGACSYCRDNRLYQRRKLEASVEEEIATSLQEESDNSEWIDPLTDYETWEDTGTFKRWIY